MPPNPLRLTLAALAAALVSLAVLLGPGAVADEAAPTPIADAPALTWGFKQSWRQYAGVPQVADGATLAAGPSAADTYALNWDFVSGSYDDAAGTTELRYEGTAHWQKYYLPDNPVLNNPPPGYGGPTDIHLLDVTLKDPVVTISRDRATISVEANSRQLATWEMLETGRVDVINLDVTDVEPQIADGVTSWSGIPAASAPGASPVFANNYPAGLAVDSVGFSYSGPGGAPDFSETWDVPGTTKLGVGQNKILTETGDTIDYGLLWVDRERRLVHRQELRTIEGQPFKVYQAFSLDTLQDVGEPLILPWAERVNQTTLLDTTSGRLFYRRSGESATTRWIRFDPEQGTQGKYVLGTLASPIPIVGNASNLSWDAVGQRAFNIRRFVPAGVGATDYDNHQWQLNLYKEQEDGVWTIETVALPSFPLGLNRRGYPESSGGLDAPSGIAARDGSLIVLGASRQSNNPSVPIPAAVPGAWRIQLDGGQATVTPIAGTDFDNVALGAFDALRAGPDGQLTLFRNGDTGIPHLIQTLDVSADGATVDTGPRTELGEFDPSGVDAFAVDREDGTAWVGGTQSRRVMGVKDGHVVADQVLALRHPRGGPLVAGPDHVVYSQTNDGSPANVGGSPIYGFGRFARLGWAPDVGTDPASQAVELDSDESAETVQLSSTGTGDPAPDRQWQVKLPGTARFTDLDGENGATLTIDAERGMGGSEYRAVYSNTAGRIASAPATLTVAYAPEIAVDVTDVEAVEGEPAVFQVLSQGSPEPDVEWQRRVGGFWQPVEEDDNFDVGNGTLTVRETNVDQSGALFRARVVNSVAATYSRAAKLTVEPAVTIPPGGLSLDGVSLDWTGSPELQRKAPNQQPNYLSAGVSDGSESTYRANAPGARVLHVSATGQESPASWAIRAAQTAGAVKQLVRLTDGHAEIEEDGSASVTWPGSFTVNFYGGLVPFTVSSPELTIDADGDGTLRGDLSGYGASQANPNDRHPIAPVAGVTIATFSGVEVDPEGKVAIEPDYQGVEVDPPAGFGLQDRTVAGWGAWPQAFVDFHGATGLAPYWYSSGGVFDDHKQADPFTVDFTGAGSVPPVVDDGDVFAPPPPPATVPRPSTTSLTFGRGQYGRSAIATVRVSVAGGPASGSVRVQVAGRTLTGALKDGAARLRLPARVRPGAHTARADYGGSPGVAASGDTATLRVAKAAPRISFAARPQGRGLRLTVVARIPRAAGVHPTGQLVVRDRGRIVRIAPLRQADKGRLRVALPRLRRGAHVLRVSLSGGELQHAATTSYRMVSVK